MTFSIVVGLCSSIGYCFSAAGPQIAHELLKLTPAEYGYWNCINIFGMLAGGLWSKVLLERYSATSVIAIGMAGTAAGLLNIALMGGWGSTSVLWFFMSTLLMYLFGPALFCGGTYIASNATSDKAIGASMMSFINMSTSTLSVIIMGYLGLTPIFAFLAVLSGLWILVVLIVLSQMRVKKLPEYLFNE